MTDQDNNDIKYHRRRVRELKAEIKKLEGELAVHNRRVKELDVARSIRIKKRIFRQKVYNTTTKQEMVVGALRSIGKPSTAGDICQVVEKNYGFKCHNSEFATKLKSHIIEDLRIVITKVNASKYVYSLAEWETGSK